MPKEYVKITLERYEALKNVDGLSFGSEIGLINKFLFSLNDSLYNHMDGTTRMNYRNALQQALNKHKAQMEGVNGHPDIIIITPDPLLR